jgi:hypothetical protein
MKHDESMNARVTKTRCVSHRSGLPFTNPAACVLQPRAGVNDCVGMCASPQNSLFRP